MAAIDDALAAQQALVGTETGISNWITVDQKMIDAFAEVTFDDQWIHVDPDRAARETPFGGTIAHGFLTLSLGSRFVYDCFPPLPRGTSLDSDITSTLRTVSHREPICSRLACSKSS